MDYVAMQSCTSGRNAFFTGMYPHRAATVLPHTLVSVKLLEDNDFDRYCSPCVFVRMRAKPRVAVSQNGGHIHGAGARQVVS
jgi:hypothetical protein